MKKVSFIFAAVLIVELLTACHHSLESNEGNQYGQQQMGPTTSRVVVVRVNQQNPAVAEYVNLDTAPSQQNFAQFATNQQNWQVVNNSQVISGTQGYKTAQQGSYFVEQPKDFVASAQPQTVQLSADYYRGGNYGCGYCHYPNYYGYDGYNFNHYYYPNYGVNYGGYNYLPTYYSNYSYWYYQPIFYYPSYYNYNYYIYSAWW